MELMGTIWFLGSVYLWFYYGQKLIDPWPNWTLAIVVPIQQLGILGLIWLTVLMFV